MRSFFNHVTETRNENSAFHNAFDDDFEKQEKEVLGKKLIKKIRQRDRKFIREQTEYDFKEVHDPMEIKQTLHFIRTHQCAQFKNSLLHHSTYFELYKTYALEAIPHREAALYAIYHAGTPVSAEFGLMGNGQYTAVLTATDTEGFGSYSPGYLLVYKIIHHRFRQGHRLYNHGIGTSQLKQDFQAEKIRLTNISVGNSLPGKLTAQTYHHAKPLKNMFRRFLPNLH